MRLKKQVPFFPLFPKIIWVMLIGIFFISPLFNPCFIWGQSRSLGFRGLVPPPNAKKEKLSGRVLMIDLPLIKIKDSIWGSSKIFVGPPGFLNEQGFHLRRGQRLAIRGVPVKVEGSEIIVAFEVEDTDTGKGIILRDKKGEPIWWGGNRNQSAAGPAREPGKKKQGNQPVN
ncbi:MAG: hypothetical protein ACMUIM_04730 [bacterium]